MYSVIEFEDGGIAVVRSEWLTPRKKEVYWPPDKELIKFDRILVKGTEITDNWKTYNILRTFYGTGKAVLLFKN